MNTQNSPVGRDVRSDGSRNITRCYYKVVGKGILLAEKHFAEIDRVKGIVKDFLVKLGAIGSYSQGNRPVVEIIMPDGGTPEGFILISKLENGLRVKPNKKTKVGKQIAEEIKALPSLPDHCNVLDQHLVKHSFIVGNDSKIHFVTATRLHYPEVGYYVTVPRFEGDNFDDRGMLLEIKASEFMAAFEENNRIVREKNQQRSEGK